LLLLTCGPWDNTVRWIPPLIVSEEQIDEAVTIFAAALERCLASH
jgi:4-aminobutyrate aminotransferase-like enzyme